jgi:phosphoribosylglycinamide formyltransferase 1
MQNGSAGQSRRMIAACRPGVRVGGGPGIWSRPVTHSQIETPEPPPTPEPPRTPSPTPPLTPGPEQPPTPGPASERLPIAVLVSGTGTNLQALLDTVHGHEAEVVGVASSVAGVPALARASAAGVATAVFARADFPDRGARDAALAAWVSQRGARLVVLAGYMELLGAPFLERFPRAVINVHPSLLPAFTGLRAIEQALEYGVKVFGVTVHFVDSGVDTGPVILQGARELPDAREAGQVLAALRPLEHALLPQAVRLFARGALGVDPANPRRVLVDRL